MKRYSMKFIYSSLIIGLLFSCKKEGTNINVSFPQTLYGTKITNKTSVRLFINKREIFDKAVINNFIKNSGDFNIQNEPIDVSDKIKFITQDTAMIGTSTIMYSVIKTNNQFLFYTPLIYIPISRDVLDGLFKYNGTKIPAPGGQYTNFVTVGYGDYVNLDISLVSYKLKYGEISSGRLGENNGIVLNEFNESYVKTLGTYDTLAIQEFRLTLKAH